MARSILAHLPFFERDPGAILEDIKIYLTALVGALSLDPPQVLIEARPCRRGTTPLGLRIRLDD